ncbi:hypothetical protein Tco_0650098 [Tanacetum coccineum]
MALYHALMESILADEDAMDQSVTDKQKKRKPDDEDRDDDPLAGPDQGPLKKRKTSKDDEPSKRIKSTSSFEGNTSSQPMPKSIGRMKLARSDHQFYSSWEGDFLSFIELTSRECASRCSKSSSTLKVMSCRDLAVAFDAQFSF